MNKALRASTRLLDPAPDTSDTEPSDPLPHEKLEPAPWSVIIDAVLERLPALSPENFRIIYNAVSAERMRRWRQKDEK